jgi:hypothetical protein
MPLTLRRDMNPQGTSAETLCILDSIDAVRRNFVWRAACVVTGL